MPANKTTSVKKGSLLRSGKFKKMKRMWMLYLFLLIPVVHVFVFNYMPMYGVQLAFKDYRAALGIWDSPWNGFKHFNNLFAGASFYRVFWNTLYISVLKIIFSFPAPIILAILLNEVRHIKYKKVIQTISYLPHFMSWVVLGGIVKEFLSPQRGVVNAVIEAFGGTPIYFITEPSMFRTIVVGSNIWATIGWGAIIYLASMSAIDPQLYESVEIDGGNRWHKTIHITLPGLLPIIVIQFILGLGNILNAGFDQIFNLYNNKVMNVADIIDTYVYRMGLEEMKYDFSTAVGLFKNVIGVILILLVNALTSKVTDYGIW